MVEDGRERSIPLGGATSSRTLAVQCRPLAMEQALNIGVIGIMLDEIRPIL